MGTTFFCRVETPFVQASPHCVPQVFLSNEGNHHTDTNTPEEFVNECERVQDEYGRLAVQVWAPGRAFLKNRPWQQDHLLAVPSYQAARDRFRPYVEALADRSLDPELWIFDYEHSPYWNKVSWRATGRLQSAVQLYNDKFSSELFDRFGGLIDYDALLNSYPERPEKHSWTEDRALDYQRLHFCYMSQLAEDFQLVFGDVCRDILGRFEAVNWGSTADEDSYDNNRWPVASAPITPGINNAVLYLGDLDQSVAASSDFWRLAGESVRDLNEDRLRKLIDQPSNDEFIPWLWPRKSPQGTVERMVEIMQEEGVNCRRALVFNPGGEEFDAELEAMVRAFNGSNG